MGFQGRLVEDRWYSDVSSGGSQFTSCNQLDTGGRLELHGLSHNNAIILEGKCFRPVSSAQLQLIND